MRFLFFLLLCLTVNNVDAQISKKVERIKMKADSLYDKYEDKIIAVDSIITEKYNKSDIDTFYLGRPKTRWTFKGRINLAGTRFRIQSNLGETTMKAHMVADHKATASLSVSYMGITLGGALNPAALAGRYKDFEININSYSNRYGFDVVTQHAKRFDGWIKMGNQPKTYPDDGIAKERSFNVNAYYAFNYRRFSYPAAFTQSYIQKRSCGSFLVGASLEWQSIKRNSEDFIKSLRLNTFNFALGAGYGYNYVPNRRWLIHWSAIPTFVVSGKQKMKVDGKKEEVGTKFPQVILTARTAAVYNIKNYFVGATGVFNFSRIGNDQQVEVRRSKWIVKTFVGIRL